VPLLVFFLSASRCLTLIPLARRGDPAIVYLDGVSPPLSSSGNIAYHNVNNDRHVMPVRKPTPPSGPSRPHLHHLKAGGNNHQMQLLQTIREQDDEGESRYVFLSYDVKMCL